MSSKKEEVKTSAKELAEATATLKSIVAKTKVGVVIIVIFYKKGKESGQQMQILSNKFSHSDMHHVINCLIRTVHPEIEAISALFGGLAAAAHSKPQSKGKK